MSRKHFSILLGLVVLATMAVTLLAPQKTGHEDSPGSALLLPDLAEAVNQAQSLSLRGAEGAEVKLQRKEAGWVIEDLHDYPANWARLKKILVDLAQARIVESKTDNPAYYDRLGVADVAGPDGGEGVEITVTAGERNWVVILGHQAEGREGQYARLAGQAGSVLIDRSFEAPLDPVDWALRQVLDVPTGTAAEVEIIHPDGDWILARKRAATDADFVLESLPEGREAVSSWSVNSLANALSDLRMEAVRPAVDEAVEGAVKFRLLTFGGVEYIAQAWQDGEEHWIALRASVPPGRPAAEGTPSPESLAQTADDEGEPDPDAAAALTPPPDDPAALAAAFNQRAGGWFFRIPDYKYDSLTKRAEALLKPLKDSGD